MSTSKSHYNNWEEKKAKYKADYCKICYSKKDLALHHVTYEFEDSILMTVCGVCHYKIHFNKKGGKRKLSVVRRETIRMLRNKQNKPKKKSYLQYAINKEKRFSCERRYHAREI